jgi:hypothetical protein
MKPADDREDGGRTAGSPAGAPPGPPRRRRIRHAVVRLLESAVVLVVLVLFYLRVWGVPAPYVRHLSSHMSSADLQVSLRRIRIDPFRGILADGFTVNHQDVPDTPVLHVRRAVFDVAWVRLALGHSFLKHVTVEGGSLHLPLAGKNLMSLQPRAFDVSDIEISLRPELNAVAVETFTVQHGGVMIDATGIVRVAEAAVPGGPSDPLRPLGRLVHLAKSGPAWIGDAEELLRSSRHAYPARALVGFDLDPSDLSRASVWISAKGNGASVRDVTFDAWTLEAALDGSKLSLPEFTLSSAGGRFHAGGTVDLKKRLAEAHIYNDLPAEFWPSLLPRRWTESASREGVQMRGKLKGEAWVGPAPFADLTRHFEGWVSADKVDARGVWIERGFASAKRSGDTFEIGKLNAVIGKTGQGPLDATGRYSPATGDFEAQFTSGFDPNEIAHLFHPVAAQIIGRFKFPDRPPSIEGVVTGRRGDLGKFAMTGTCLGSNLTYNGVALARFETGVAHSNEVLRMEPFSFTRGDGHVDGWLVYDFARNVFRMDLGGTVDPPGVGRIVGGGLQRTLDRFRFEQPVTMAVAGTVDARGDARTDLNVEAEGKRMGYNWFTADRLTLTTHALGGSFFFTNVVGEAYGGTFGGDVVVSPRGKDFHYSTSVAVSNALLDEVIAAAHTGKVQNLDGRLDVHVAMEGIAGEGKGRTVTGSGDIVISKGRLFRVPMLGGLSRLIGLIYPGLSYASQTDFTGTFDIREGQIVSQDILLQGNLITLRGRGRYHFDGRLDFKVQVQLLRASGIGYALRFFTKPVSRLFEVSLTGTADEPRWSALGTRETK